ncbi:MarR family transcriptional regulator [uncultured Clostridium sp.]|uniref:MarR family winged helix-turn-helix transcriptional regulator n=1 Tax=uncultured Clostridium sp. TaxID=59620 RepID=UPI00263A3476|nr:MarR family transcriptional regulator [uncultured Clostridium sp.]
MDMDDEKELVFLKNLGSLMRAHFSVTHCELEKEGLYPGQPQLLFTLYKANGVSQREIADKLKIKPATITVMIKRLEKSGFLFKEFDKKDRRVSRIFLSEKGFQTCERLKIVFRKLDKICLENFTDKEIETLNNLILKVKTNLENYNKTKDGSCLN